MPSKDRSKVVVRFELPAAICADSVHLVGDSDHWNQTSLPMTRDSPDDVRYTVLELERGREHRFRYVVNGSQWHNDWRANKCAASPFGGTNSVAIT